MHQVSGFNEKKIFVATTG